MAKGSLLELVKVSQREQSEGSQAQSVQDRVAALDKEKHEALREWASHPWLYAIGRWEGKPIWVTQDEEDDWEPYKAFPRNYEWLKLFLHGLWLLGRSRKRKMTVEVSELWEQIMGSRPDVRDPRMMVVDKSRQMLITIATLLFADWLCSFHFQRFVILSKSTEPEAAKMLEDKIRTPRSFSPDTNPVGGVPEWFHDLCPISFTPANFIRYGLTGSRIWGVDQNFYEGEGRGITSSLAIVDEAAFQRKLPKIIQAIRPQEGRMVLMSTAEQGNPGADYMYELLEREL